MTLLDATSVLAVAKSIDFNGLPGLRFLAINRHVEDRLVATAGYEDKAAAVAYVENAKVTSGTMAEFMTE